MKCTECNSIETVTFYNMNIRAFRSKAVLIFVSPSKSSYFLSQ